MSESKQSRYGFIDFTRGFVMILMAWDHVSGFWNPGKKGGEGLGGYFPVYNDLVQFLLRFMTHVCAPTFIFLAGTSLAISTGRRQSRGESEYDISKRIALRGLILLGLSHFIVRPSFGMNRFYFGVISCIGVCLIVFSILRRLPVKMIFILSTVIICFNQFIDLNWLPSETFWTVLRVIVHDPQTIRSLSFSCLYPILPWLGVMGYGWCFGSLINTNYWQNTQQLVKPLLKSGSLSILLFILVRGVNGYGNLVFRSGNTLIAWLSLSKYPPSVAFLLWTLGLMSLILALGLKLEKSFGIVKRVEGVVRLFGKTALFFYLTHLPLYRHLPTLWNIPRKSLDLSGVAFFWVLGLCLLWGSCYIFLKLKRQYPKSLLQYI